MFLSSFLGSPAGRRGPYRSNKSKHSKHNSSASASPPSRSPNASSEYLCDKSQLQPATQPPDDVVELNQHLETLAGLFPDIQIEVFREMLSNFSDESKLFVVTDKLLKSPSTFVKGRRRASDQTTTNQKPVISRTEAFRTKEYKASVKALAMHEFKGLPRSSIDAVLSEYNYSYLDARPTLVELSSKSWKFTISSIIFRRKPVTFAEAETHPLIIWRPSDDGSLQPTLRATGNAELDKELFEELIMPLKKREQMSREESDRALAVSLHTEEAEAYDATYECTCCFTDSVFEEFTTCNTDGHMVCFRCVQHSVTEAIFGQGWQRTINKDTGTLRCPAVSSSECEGYISSEHIQRAMHEEKKGAEILQKLDQRLAEHGLISSGLPLIRCPFCSYAEVDDLYMPTNIQGPKLRVSNIPNIVILLGCLFFFFPLSFPILIIVLACLALYLNRSVRDYVSRQFTAAMTRYQRRRRGLKFTCQNPACARASCLSCSKAWADIHVCHESSLVALRTQVEQAMSMAVKRVCPRCNTSFVKTAGCNKLTCPCGYKMCYVCRKDIGTPNEGYQHFCQHFRPEGDGRRCKECNKCNLWEAENTEAILRQAKAEAERKWRETERRELSNAEKAYLQDGGGSIGNENGVLSQVLCGRIPSIEEFCDFVIEILFV
ncbi:hypothetical protein F4809DRAFT_633582 [Biscogniauxia mediterranea]|nr:hypothetical protein F4809DRAFT_633582 [Biscogniauxia mediterranea]